MINIIRIILVMTLSGSIMALILFTLKPVLRDRLPKFAQYYLWLVVIAALLVPVSKIIELPRIGTSAGFALPATPSIVVNQYIHIAREEPDRFQVIPDLRIQKEYINPPQDDHYTQSPISITLMFFTFVYPFGVTTVLLYYISSFYTYIRLHRRRNCPAGPVETALLKNLCCARRAPLLYRNLLAATPILIGVFQPVIILPDREYTEGQLQAVLLHELTHLRRMDIPVRWLTVLACAIHWFNPVVWFTRREVDRACELSCDEAVITGLDINGKQNYGDTLIYLASEVKVPKTVLSRTMSAEKKALKERLGAIMRSRKRTRAAFVVSTALIIAAAGSAAVLGAGNSELIYYPLENSSNLLAAGSAQSATNTESTEPAIEPDKTATITTSAPVFDIAPGDMQDEIHGSDDNIQQPWQLNPEEVAYRYATETLNFQGTASLSGNPEKESARVIFTKENGDEIHIDLYQPAVKGEGGIWEIEGWYAENYRHNQVRDLTALPPLFYNDVNIPENIRKVVRDAVTKQWTDAFSVHYQVLGFMASDVSYVKDNRIAEISCMITIVTQNYYRDPDTVDYIIEAKEKDLAGYQLLYDEYNMPKTVNSHFKATMWLTSSGDVELDTLQIYPNPEIFFIS